MIKEAASQTHLSKITSKVAFQIVFVTFTETNEDNHPDHHEIEDNLELETSEPAFETRGVDGECSLENAGSKVVRDGLLNARVHGVARPAPSELPEIYQSEFSIQVT